MQENSGLRKRALCSFKHVILLQIMKAFKIVTEERY